jgi:hypothetical protein
MYKRICNNFAPSCKVEANIVNIFYFIFACKLGKLFVFWNANGFRGQFEFCKHSYSLHSYSYIRKHYKCYIVFLSEKFKFLRRSKLSLQEVWNNVEVFSFRNWMANIFRSRPYQMREAIIILSRCPRAQQPQMQLWSSVPFFRGPQLIFYPRDPINIWAALPLVIIEI